MASDTPQALVDSVKTFTGQSLTKRASPLLPRNLPPGTLKGIDLCEASLHQVFRCLNRLETEGFCQDELFVYANCKFKRDEQVRQKIEDWWRVEASRLSPADISTKLKELQSELESTVSRLQMVEPVDSSQSKFRTQLEGEVQDLQSWISILSKQSHSSKKPLQQQTNAPKLPSTTSLLS